MKQYLIHITFVVLFLTTSSVVDIAYAQENLPLKSPENESKHQKEKQHALQTDDYLWMEKFHRSFSNTVYQSAVWFDNFFIEDNMEQASPTTNARLRIGWEPKAGDFNELTSRFRIKVHLPYFKNKVDVILSDSDDFNQNNLPLDTVNTHQVSDEDNFEAALRYTHKKEKNRFLESRVGISGGDIFIKSRVKRRLNVGKSHSFKIEPAIYYFLNDGLGARLLLEYDYQLNDNSQLRVNYSMRASKSFTGLKWKQGFYKLTQFEEKAASIIGFRIEGEHAGDNGSFIKKYLVSYRYRFNALKEWLFFEIEPFLEWEEKYNYDTTPGIALRVEGHFAKG